LQQQTFAKARADFNEQLRNGLAPEDASNTGADSADESNTSAYRNSGFSQTERLRIQTQVECRARTMSTQYCSLKT